MPGTVSARSSGLSIGTPGFEQRASTPQRTFATACPDSLNDPIVHAPGEARVPAAISGLSAVPQTGRAPPDEPREREQDPLDRAQTPQRFDMLQRAPTPLVIARRA